MTINKQRLIIATTLLIAFGLVISCIATKADAKAKPLPSPDHFAVKKVTEKSLVLYWDRVPGAKGYVVYKKKGGKYKKEDTSHSRVWIDRNAEPGKKYGYKVRAYKTVKKNKVYSKYSYPVSAITYSNKGKVGNVTKLKIYTPEGKTVLGLGMKQEKDEKLTYDISAKRKGKKRKPLSKKVRWYSTDTSIATIDQKRQISAKRKAGTCYVYAVAHNGLRSNYYKVVVKDYAYQPINIADLSVGLQFLFSRHEKDIRDICSYYCHNPTKKLWTLKYDGENFYYKGTIPNDKMIDRVKKLLIESPYITSISIGTREIEINIHDSYLEEFLKFVFNCVEDQKIDFHNNLAPHWFYRRVIHGADTPKRVQ